MKMDREEKGRRLLWRIYYLFLLVCPVVMILAANKDFIKYHYKIDESKKIEAKAGTPYIVNRKEEKWMKVELMFEYQGNSHSQLFWRKIDESKRESTYLYPVKAAGNSEEVIFVRGFIFPYMLTVYFQIALTVGVLLYFEKKRTRHNIS